MVWKRYQCLAGTSGQKLKRAEQQRSMGGIYEANQPENADCL